MPDIGGYLTSPSFLVQLASFITALLSAFASGVLSNFFTGQTATP